MILRMSLPFDEPPVITAVGSRISSAPVENYTIPATIRRNARAGNLPGPLPGGGLWSSWGWTGKRAVWRYQELAVQVYPLALIRVRGSIDLPIHGATEEELRVLDRSLELVPPPHLQMVQREKPDGFYMADAIGRGSSNPEGGLNPDYDPTIILLTHTSILAAIAGGFSPTLLHEIGHVMTHPGRYLLSIALTDPDLWNQIRARYLSPETRVSTNPGELEPLCNAYANLLCYGATDPRTRAYGTGSNTDLLRSPRTREALRRCPAFARLDDPLWRERYAER